MAIPITCPGCKAAFEVPDNLAGKTIRCTSCKTQVTIPAAVPVAAAKSAAKKRRDDDDDDDDDDQPKRKNRAQAAGAGNGMMIALIGGGLLALGAIVGLSIWLLSGDDKKDTAKKDDGGNVQP